MLVLLTKMELIGPQQVSEEVIIHVGDLPKLTKVEMAWREWRVGKGLTLGLLSMTKGGEHLG